VALDYPGPAEANELLAALQGIPCMLKVGMQLFYAAGPQFIATLKEKGYRVFLDLKLHDIPHQVKGAARSITRLGVDMFNVHAAGGIAMMEAASEGVEEALARENGLERPVLIAVTQLTSTNQQVLNGQIGIPGTIAEAVRKYARLARQAGLHGVVASALEVPEIKQACGRDFVTVTPGIRPIWAGKGDQMRVMTPREAIANGSDYIVIGRPITASADPRQALETILEELT
ncbi:MAG TPA: orotidine-5'-phosphate decarboxylase, partial [Bacilli bacterium]